MTTLLSSDLLADTLLSLPGWQGDQQAIWREVHLETDAAAAFREQVESSASSMGHAAQLEEVPGGFRVTLTTPEAGGVTELDIALASRVSDLAHRVAPEEPGVTAVRRDDVDVVVGDEDPLELSTQPERVGKVPVRF